MTHIHHGCFYAAHLVAQQVNGYHGQCVYVTAIARHVGIVGILKTKILAETQHLCLHPRLLHLYEDGLTLSLAVDDGGTEVDAVDGEVVGEWVVVLVVTHVHLHHLLLQQGRKYGAGNALVFHEILEHNVVNRIGYYHGYYALLQFAAKGTQ